LTDNYRCVAANRDSDVGSNVLRRSSTRDLLPLRGPLVEKLATRRPAFGGAAELDACSNEC